MLKLGWDKPTGSGNVQHCSPQRREIQIKRQTNKKNIRNEVFHQLLTFQGWVCTLEPCRHSSHGWARLPRMFYTEARRRNSSDRSQEQTGQDQSVDEADIDPANPTGLWHSIHIQCFSSAFISFHWNESSVSVHAQQGVSIWICLILLDISQMQFLKYGP